jgi:hypothetical protein
LLEHPPPANPPYRAFLLRCWQEAGAGPGGESAWRFTLVQLDNKQHKAGFATLEDLCSYIQEELGRPG